MDIKIIYEDKDLMVVDKPAGIIVFPEGVGTKSGSALTIINLLIKKYPKLAKVGKPPRYGVIHRLDKDTSGILLIAKNNQSLAFFQKQFKNRQVEKKYIALVVGNIKQDKGVIETLIGRSPQNKLKQKSYPLIQESSGRREAITEFKVQKKYKCLRRDLEHIYTLVEVLPKTGRKHQIRCHLSYLSHPIAGDKLYGFKNQPCPEGLQRHFLHASELKIKLPNSHIEEFKSELPQDLAKTIENLEEIE